MSWGEALRLTERLSTDPSSHVAAALAEWDHPLPWQALVSMDLFDLQHQAAWAQSGGKGSRPQPYPRPWKPAAKVRKRGNAAGRSFEEIRQILNDHGHALN